MQGPSVTQALGLALRVLAREVWLAVLGMAVALARGALVFPAMAFAAAASLAALRASLATGSTPPEAALFSIVGLWTSPRARSIAVGLWLAGWLLWGALRAAWVAGSLSALGRQVVGSQGDPPAFAAGVAYRFDRVLVTAAAALVLELGGLAMVGTSAAAAGMLLPAAREASSRGPIAAVAALALSGSVFVAVCLSVLGEVAVARAAMAGELPGRALTRAVAAVALRPAAFVAAALAVAVATLLATGSIESLFAVLAGAAAGAPRALLVAPQLLLAALTALLAAFAELWRLAALGVLALGADAPRGTPGRWSERSSPGRL
ncbi:MAG TPA: hypothetical protein VMT17_18825 [Anaeromyxobacteraceae bacterium]|nr:hypothetical protein [Anaeromyxobacteraceae bacterium]